MKSSSMNDLQVPVRRSVERAGLFWILTAAVLAIIVHGSLYPYSFHMVSDSKEPVATLLDSWATPPSGFADFIANLALYVPFGFFAVLTLQSRYRVLLVAFLGFTLCTCIEVAQFYDVGRVTNMSDVYLNTCGTLLGAALGVSFDAIPQAVNRDATSPPVTFVLLIAFLGARLYPYVPTIDVHKYWHAVKGMVLHPNFYADQIFRYFALWLTVCYLVSTIFRKSAILAIFVFSAFVFGAKIVIVNLAVSASEIAGASIAVAMWLLLLARSRAAAAVVFSVLGLNLVVLRLQPFNFHTPPFPFGWIPFRSLLQGSLDVNFTSFLEKIFLYGSLIWIGIEAGLRSWISTCVVAALLLLTSWLERYLPGRSAEITDSAMALLMGGALAATSPAHLTHRVVPAKE
jgi:VanZ family protein